MKLNVHETVQELSVTFHRVQGISISSTPQTLNSSMERMQSGGTNTRLITTPTGMCSYE